MNEATRTIERLEDVARKLDQAAMRLNVAVAAIDDPNFRRRRLVREALLILSMGASRFSVMDFDQAELTAWCEQLIDPQTNAAAVLVEMNKAAETPISGSAFYRFVRAFRRALRMLVVGDLEVYGREFERGHDDD